MVSRFFVSSSRLRICAAASDGTHSASLDGRSAASARPCSRGFADLNSPVTRKSRVPMV